ncbi:MAG: hypothetical protein SGBAC_005040 [Bacillariaceae sp.]
MSDWSALPSPAISAKQCQKLADKYFQNDVPLAGRPVMIPFTKQAFVMGELQPLIQSNSESGTGSMEVIQVRPGKDKKLQSLSTNDAKQWLLKKAQSASKQPPATAKKSIISSTSAKKAESQSSNNPSAPSTRTAKPTGHRKTQKSPAPPMSLHSTMVEIHEEFNDEGIQTKGGVVNVTSEFQALMDKIGQGDEMNFPQGNDMSGETKEDLPEDGSGEEMMTDYDTPLRQLSDPEFDQLAKRLDELARLEESEIQRLQQGARAGKLKAQRAANNKKKSSGGWNKGFLNQPKKKKSSKNGPTTKALSKSTTNQTGSQTLPPPSSDQATTAATSRTSQVIPNPTSEPKLPQPPASATTAAASASPGGVAFDLSQNRVQEIPSLPGTRPVPPRNNVSMSSNPATAADPSIDDPTIRMMNSTAFSGVIQERPTVSVASAGDGKETNAIQERTAPKSFRRRRQQQQQTQPEPQTQDPNKPKKKLSRFAQERME